MYKKQEYKYNTINKTNPSTPRRIKNKTNSSIDFNNLKQNSIMSNKSNNNKNIKKKESSDIKAEEPVLKTPKDILSSLLHKTLGKSLLKLESSTKEQSSTLKYIGKFYIVFEKNLLMLKNGVDKKRKEDEKKQKEAKKMKMSSMRSKTVSNFRKVGKEDSLMSTGRRGNKNNIKLNSTLFSKKKESIEETPKIRSRTLKTSRTTTSYPLRPKKSKEKNNEKIENTPKRNNLSKTKTQIRLSSGTSAKKSENSKEKNHNRFSIKDKNNIQNTNPSSIKRESIRSRSRKNTLSKAKEKGKFSRRNSRKMSKKLSGNKRIIKIEGGDKNKELFNNKENNDNEENNNYKETEKTLNLAENDLNLNENININQIIVNKKKERPKDENDIDNVLKELEEFNEKKPRFMVNEAEVNRHLRERVGSRSKNKEKDNISIEKEKEIEGSLNEVKLMVEGVSGVLDKIKSEKKKNFEKKTKIEKNDEEKNKNNEENNSKIQQIDNEVKELLKFEEKNEKNNDINQNNTKNDNNEKDKNEVQENIFIKSSILPENKKNEKEENNSPNENINSKDNNFPIKFGKESQIINEEIIKTIQSDKMILTNSIFDSNINSIVIGSDKSENTLIDNNKNMPPIKEDQNELKNSEINDKNQINNEININNDNNITNKEEVIENNTDNNNIINKLEEKIKEKEQKLNEERKDIIQSESGIMRDENLLDPSQSLNQSSFMNQSSIMNQSAILAADYFLITRDPDAPFSIENVLKFDKNQCLCILDFLNFQEKFQFTGINRGFNIERIYLLNNKREEMIRSLELSPRETIDDLIMKTRLQYSNEELSKSFVEYQIPRGGAKAVELLNNDLYSKLFKKPILEKNAEEICTVYRVLFALFGEFEIANIYGDKSFWIKCTEYMIKNSNGKIGTFILEKMKGITFEHQKIFLLNKLLVGMKKKINPNYFSKICGTTGLLIFLIKETLEYCGVIINDKKTQPARILDNLLYYKNSIDSLAQFIDKLSAIKTYKIREKKDKDKEKENGNDNK